MINTKIKEFCKKKSKELWELFNEVWEGPEAWWSPPFSLYAFCCLFFAILALLDGSYTFFWICIGIFLLWFVSFLLE